MMGALVLLMAFGAVAAALSPVWPDVGVAGNLVVVAFALWCLHRALCLAEDRGWLYYRKKRGSDGGLGVTSEFLNMYDPSRKYLQQTVRQSDWKRAEDDDGEPKD